MESRMNPYLIAADARNPPFAPHLFHLVYADPPHTSGWDETSYRLIDSYEEFANDWLFRVQSLLAANSYLIICVDDHTRYTYERLMQYYKGFIKPVQSLIWYYDFGPYTRKRFVPSHTTLLVYKRGRPSFYWDQVAEVSQRMKSGDLRSDWRGRTPGSVFNIPRVPGNSKDRAYLSQHRSCQPVELCEKLVKAYTPNKSPSLILDLFCGSGSMAKACQKLGRICVSMDINPSFIAEANNRVHKDWERFIREDT